MPRFGRIGLQACQRSHPEMRAIAIRHFATIGVLHILFADTGDGANRMS
jgi:hypothetical protein